MPYVLIVVLILGAIAGVVALNNSPQVYDVTEITQEELEEIRSHYPDKGPGVEIPDYTEDRMDEITADLKAKVAAGEAIPEECRNVNARLNMQGFADCLEAYGP